jgi:hypothetical protein
MSDRGVAGLGPALRRQQGRIAKLIQSHTQKAQWEAAAVLL